LYTNSLFVADNHMAFTVDLSSNLLPFRRLWLSMAFGHGLSLELHSWLWK